MANGNFLTGYPGQVNVLPTKTQQQQDLLNNYISQTQSQLGQYNPSFEPIQQAANRNYAQQAVPNLSAFLASQGVEPGGSASDAAYKSSFNDFQLKSLAQRAQFEQGQQANLNNMVGTALGTSAFENIYQPPQEGLLQAAAPGAAYAATAALAPAAGAGLAALGAKAAGAAGGIGAALTSPWFWVPIAVGGGLYLLYKGGKWIYQRLTNQQANQMRQQGLQSFQQSQQQNTQGQQNPSIAQRLQNFAAPNFATQGV